MQVKEEPKKKSPANPRIAEIQKWLKEFSGSIKNAYEVNAEAIREAGTGPGIIEAILWRVAKEDTAMSLTNETMMDVLSPAKLKRELRKQVKLNEQEQESHSKAFEKSRRQLIASKIPEKADDRNRLIDEIENWFKTELPQMRDTKAILSATELRLEAGRDIHPVIPPLKTTADQIAKLRKDEPGRLYVDKNKQVLLLLKPKEKAVLDDKGLRIETAAPTAPSPAMS